MTNAVYAQRRTALRELVRQQYPECSGAIVLWANLEYDVHRFRQEASFYYFTGVHEAGALLAIDVQTGYTMLFVPHTEGIRQRWVGEALQANAASAQKIGVDEVRFIGQPVGGHTLVPLFGIEQYQYGLAYLRDVMMGGGALFTTYPAHGVFYAQQVALIQRMCAWEPVIQKSLIDVSASIARMRRKKGRDEIEQIYRAVVLTGQAQQAAAQLIKAGCCECEMHAAIEYVYTANGACSAFVPIVASGQNTVTIHHQAGMRTMQKGELVIVDCGACVDGYCADITRTYPVDKKWTDKQRALYAQVLEAHDYVASLVKPGMYLSNAAVPEQSLSHLALQFFAQRGYDKFFGHGIGHFLGLDVHDVGDPHEPLQDGDVITIEPGLYIPEQGMGVRIEDDYWVIKDGAHNLSEDLPVALDEVSEMIGNL